MKKFYVDENWTHSVNCDKCSSACPVVQNAQAKGINVSFLQSQDGEQIEFRLALPDTNYIDQIKSICATCIREKQR